MKKPEDLFTPMSVSLEVSRMLRIFIAGRSTMREQIALFIKQLRDFGHWGYDWTQDPGWTDPSRYFPLTVANRDLAEVTLADGVIWVIDELPSHGAPYEVGYADRGGQPIVVLWNGPYPNKATERLLYAYRHPFTFTLEDAVRELERMVAAREETSPLGLVTTNRLHEVEQKAAHAVTLLHEFSEDVYPRLKQLEGKLGLQVPPSLLEVLNEGGAE